MDGSWRQATKNTGWTELGSAMVITGVILLISAVSVGAVVGMAVSGAMVLGGLLVRRVCDHASHPAG